MVQSAFIESFCSIMINTIFLIFNKWESSIYLACITSILGVIIIAIIAEFVIARHYRKTWYQKHKKHAVLGLINDSGAKQGTIHLEI